MQQTVDAKIGRLQAGKEVRVLLPLLAVDPPKPPITVAANTTVVLYDDTVDKYSLEYAFIQNVGINKVKYAINDDAGTANYHGVLAAGVANEDGMGGTVELNRFRIKKLTVYAEAAAASQVAVVLAKNTSRVNPIEA